ncbi:thymidine kinase [Paracoccus cavernae]|uniref:Thymidine kinase n=1 Tax=Paracoccus cavernae TaxID=1571207 RepID=A0ABT8D3B2_9RHOB|nr:thymidine kinase [Paracoccus cavernae]
MAKLYFHYSTMNAGKSTLLLQASYNYRERGMETLLLTAALDDRAGEGTIASRIGICETARTFTPQTDLFALIAEEAAVAACIFLDEAQFLTEAQVWQLARVADDLGQPVMCYGLRVDFRGQLFPAPPRFWRWPTICARSARSAIAARRPRWSSATTIRAASSLRAQVQIGGNETYISLCRRHWRAAMQHS